MEDIKHLWKFFVLIFIVAVLIFNWSELVLFSDYRVIWHNIKGFFGYSEEKFLISEQVGRPKEDNFLSESFSKTKGPNNQPKRPLNNYIQIPKINVLAPFASGRGGKSAKEILKKGVLLYSGGALPGRPGLTYILGHSAPLNWPDINYDNVFNKIKDLEPGDEIFVYFQNQRFTYEVFSQSIFFPKNEEQVFNRVQKENRGNVLVLITCWPLGKDYKRLAVFSKSRLR